MNLFGKVIILVPIFISIVILGIFVFTHRLGNQASVSNKVNGRCDLDSQSYVVCGFSRNEYVYFKSQLFVDSNETFSSGPVEIKIDLSKIANLSSQFYLCGSSSIVHQGSGPEINGGNSLIGATGKDLISKWNLTRYDANFFNSTFCSVLLNPNQTYVISDKGSIPNDVPKVNLFKLYLTTDQSNTPHLLIGNFSNLTQIFSYGGGVVSQ